MVGACFAHTPVCQVMIGKWSFDDMSKCMKTGLAGVVAVRLPDRDPLGHPQAVVGDSRCWLSSSHLCSCICDLSSVYLLRLLFYSRSWLSLVLFSV